MSSPAADLFLLDTHVWIWVFEGVEHEFAERIKEPLRRASREGAILVSALSVWELAMLEVKGRIRLSLECRAWVSKALAAPGVRLKSLTPAIAIESTRLPGVVHGDPVDRMLLATARVTGARLVTRDVQMLQYAKSRQMPVLDATP